jgi:hypothetical protein
MNHSEMTKHIRGRVKAAGIKARVYKDVSCGSEVIVVAVPNAETTFSDDEQYEIALIGLCNNLSYVRNTPILPYAFTKPQQFNFYL